MMGWRGCGVVDRVNDRSQEPDRMEVLILCPSARVNV